VSVSVSVSASNSTRVCLCVCFSKQSIGRCDSDDTQHTYT